MLREPLETAASEEPILSKIGRVACAQQAECTQKYMRTTRRIHDSPSGPFAARMFAPASCLRSPSTTGAQHRFREVPYDRGTRASVMPSPEESSLSSTLREARRSGLFFSAATANCVPGGGVDCR